MECIVFLVLFAVLVADAGEGIVEICISDPNGRLVPNHTLTDNPGCLDVNFAPTVAGIHRGSVTFNKEKVPGTYFVIHSMLLPFENEWH